MNDKNLAKCWMNVELERERGREGGRGERERVAKKKEKKEWFTARIVSEKNEWLYLSVIKTVPKNKQTHGNKARVSFQTRHSCCAPENSNKRLR